MKTELQQLAQCLLDDFLLLADGEWTPDQDSIACSIENAKKVLAGVTAMQSGPAVPEAIRKIDWKKLRQQKRWLVAYQGGDDNAAEGLLNLLDHIQDAAVADGLASEEEVFGRTK